MTPCPFQSYAALAKAPFIILTICFLRRDTPHHLKNKRVSQGVDKERVATIIAQVSVYCLLANLKEITRCDQQQTKKQTNKHLNNQTKYAKTKTKIIENKAGSAERGRGAGCERGGGERVDGRQRG